MKRVLPPVYLLMALLIMAVLHVVWPLHRYLAVPWNLLGLIPLMAGVLLNVLADRQFTRHQTTVNPFNRPTGLVTGFPFSMSRNPMYLGLVMILLGTALLFGTVTPTVPVIAFALLMDQRFIHHEERALQQVFGDAWEAYRSRVRRWL